MTQVLSDNITEDEVVEVIDDEGVEVIEEPKVKNPPRPEFKRLIPKSKVAGVSKKAEEESRDVYRAYGAALKLWNCRDEEILIEGPAGTGKTRAILEKIFFCAMKYPKSRHLLVRKTRESMTQSVLEIWENKVVPKGTRCLYGAKRNLRQSYYFPNGSEIVVGGIDKPGKIMSTEYDIIAAFETTEFTEEDFESLTTRLRNGAMPYSQIIADCNPDAPRHWLNRRPDSKGMTRLLSRHEDNPRWFDHKTGKRTPQGEGYIGKLDKLSGARKLRLRFGKWAAAEGAVYESWDANVHLISRSQLPGGKIPEHWRRFITVDFGFTNPFVCQWWAVDDDGRMYLYREIYKTKTLVQKHAAKIKMHSRGENIEMAICDWDAEDRATLNRYGIDTTPAYKFITPGIEAVQARLLPEEDGRPRIFILRDALVDADTELVDQALPFCTAHEVDNYHYPKGMDGKPNKEEPVKKDDHGMDAMRYGVAYVDNLSGLMLKVAAEESATVMSTRAA